MNERAVKDESTEISERAPEFDCIECGRHIISIGNNYLQRIHPNTCAACWSLPGWYNDPELARAIDPEGDRKPPKWSQH